MPVLSGWRGGCPEVRKELNPRQPLQRVPLPGARLAHGPGAEY